MKLKHLRLSRLLIRLLAFVRQHLLALCFLVLVIILGFISFKGLDILSKLHVKPQDLLSFFGPPAENLETTNGTTNFLVLGIRGEGVDSPNLSDTIIVLSFNHQNKSLSLISIPRDLWVPSLQAKINTAYYYGYEKNSSPSAGIKNAQAAILEDLGLPIHYTAVVNFTIFKETIDLLGGIDIQIDRGFTDNEFPIPGQETALPLSSRFESISFATGSAHLDGNTALKYVRSRHSFGEEGTDFSRSRRQQQVISALKQKMLTPTFLLDKNKLDQFFTILDRNLITNISHNLYPTLAKTALETQNNPIRTISLSNLPDEDGLTILYNPPVYKYKGEWVLMPQDNNWTALKKYLNNKLSQSQ